MNNSLKNKGFIEPVIEADHYIAGTSSLPCVVIQPDRNWTPYLVKNENQIGSFGDTFNCSAFGSLDALEVLMKKKFGVEYNWSDRALGLFAGTYPPGNDVHVVCETIRKHGLVEDAVLPFDSSCTTIDKYYSPKPVPRDLIDKASKFIEDFSYGHEWLYKDPGTPLATKQALLLENLQYGPLSVSVVGWRYRNNMYYKLPGEADNHWVALINVVEGQYWEVFDSTDSYIKRLEWNYDFGYSKRHSIEKNMSSQAKSQNLVAMWLESIRDWWNGLSAPEQQALTPVKPVIDNPKPMQPNVISTHLWDTPANVKHSLRVICDEEGLSVPNKNVIDACIHQESNYNTQAVNHNLDKVTGKTLSSDWGLCQINDYYHIGQGKEFASVEEVLNNPEKSVRFMIKMMKAGKMNLWVSYTSKAYLKYL